MDIYFPSKSMEKLIYPFPNKSVRLYNLTDLRYVNLLKNYYNLNAFLTLSTISNFSQVKSSTSFSIRPLYGDS